MKSINALKPYRDLAPIVLVAMAAGALPAAAYESYHNPSTPGQGYCAQCHPGFVGGTSSSLHAMHTGGTDPVTTTCSLCHTGSGRDNPLTMWSQNNQLGCMGCHGLDYGETVQANYRSFATAGLHKNSGYGLRRRHARNGVALCSTCHTNDVNVAPYGEDVIDTGRGFTTHYYSLATVNLRGLPINPCSNEDTLNDADSRGLDNDGDGLYDAADPDCSKAPVTLSLTMTATNTAIFSWPSTFDGWHLQVSSSLDSATWTNLPNVPHEIAGSTWQIVLPTSPGSLFYRLNKDR